MLSYDKKVNELLSDTEFFKKIISMKTAEEVQSAFEKAGAEVPIEDVQEIGAVINEVLEKLNEENLESVSGGVNPAGFLAGMGMIIRILDVARDVEYFVQAVKWSHRRH